MADKVNKTVYVDPDLWDRFREKYKGNMNDRFEQLLREDLDSKDQNHLRKLELKRRAHEIIDKL